MSFTIPDGDPALPPGSEVSITRGQVDPANGNVINAVTQYLDLSQVYGSDPTTADSLRNPDGATPRKATTCRSSTVSMSVAMSVPLRTPISRQSTCCWDREHNYWVGQLHSEDPSLSGDQLYARARAITTAEYQNIVYTEFLPHLLGTDTLSSYHGFNSSVSPQISEEFSTAAYRFGHSTVSPEETKIANDGTVLEQKDLVDASAEQTSDLPPNGGADALLRNLAQDFSQEFSARP